MFSMKQILFVATVAFGALTLSRADRDTTYPACDKECPGPVKHTKSGLALPFEISDQPVFYLAPGLGACGKNYTDNDYVACLNPGWVHSAYHSKCGEKVAVANPQTGKQITATVLDVCGAVPNSTFGCNDIYLSKIAFEKLGGNTTVGRLTSNVTWAFEPSTFGYKEYLALKAGLKKPAHKKAAHKKGGHRAQDEN